ncbi:putative mitochondrial protein, partial [Mucuna pruriens]
MKQLESNGCSRSRRMQRERWKDTKQGLLLKDTSNNMALIMMNYAKKVLEKFKMFDYNPVNTPVEGSLKLSRFGSGEKEDPTLFKSLVGSLRYLTSTRSDIMYAVGVVCRFMEAPTSTHMKAAKRIFRYLKGTLDFGLFYSSSNEFKLMGFCDSDFTGNVGDRKSTADFVFFMGGCAFTWNFKKQAIVTLSTCKAEYVLQLFVRVKLFG